MLTASLTILGLTTVAVAVGDRLLAYYGSPLATPAAVLFIPGLPAVPVRADLCLLPPAPGPGGGADRHHPAGRRHSARRGSRIGQPARDRPRADADGARVRDRLGGRGGDPDERHAADVAVGGSPAGGGACAWLGMADARRRVERGDRPAVQLRHRRALRGGGAGAAVGGAGRHPPGLAAVLGLDLDRVPGHGGAAGQRRPRRAAADHAAGCCLHRCRQPRLGRHRGRGLAVDLPPPVSRPLRRDRPRSPISGAPVR